MSEEKDGTAQPETTEGAAADAATDTVAAAGPGDATDKGTESSGADGHVAEPAAETTEAEPAKGAEGSAKAVDGKKSVQVVTEGGATEQAPAAPRVVVSPARKEDDRAADAKDEDASLGYGEGFVTAKKERRPPFKNPMGGITQVPWTPTKRRGPIAAEYQSPGPACVALANLTGGSSVPDSKRNRAPAFSFGSRPGGKQDSPGPGPGQYNVTGLSAKGKDNPPASSLHSRPKDVKSSQTPAPGDYNPEKSEKIVHNSPKFTFGLKTQPGRLSNTPAPNVYNIPTVLGATKEGNKKQAPAFTISGRQKDKIDDRINNPGPGSYNDAKADNYKTKSPAYSISSRYQMPSDPSPKPGPGAHSPEKVFMNLRWAPNYSFGIKHSQYKGDSGFKLVQDTTKSRCTCTC